MVDEMAEDSDEELVVHTSPCRTQLSKPTNKIVKLCSPVFRVELVKKRGRPPKKGFKMIGCFVNIRGVEHPDKQRF
jgi:hypothetical protein